ncbi:MAG: hypothetical protein ACE5OZ_11880 [Candidatus Heimdallarchaeota archaeon]
MQKPPFYQPYDLPRRLFVIEDERTELLAPFPQNRQERRALTRQVSRLYRAFATEHGLVSFPLQITYNSGAEKFWRNDWEEQVCYVNFTPIDYGLYARPISLSPLFAYELSFQTLILLQTLSRAERAKYLNLPPPERSTFLQNCRRGKRWPEFSLDMMLPLVPVPVPSQYHMQDLIHWTLSSPMEWSLLFTHGVVLESVMEVLAFRLMTQLISQEALSQYLFYRMVAAIGHHATKMKAFWAWTCNFPFISPELDLPPPYLPFLLMSLAVERVGCQKAKLGRDLLIYEEFLPDLEVDCPVFAELLAIIERLLLRIFDASILDLEAIWQEITLTLLTLSSQILDLPADYPCGRIVEMSPLEEPGRQW